MLDNLLDLAKTNPFLNPFQTARCSGAITNDQISKPALVPTRNIVAASATGNHQQSFFSI